MEKFDINTISTSEDLRLYVLEFALFVEELISETIGRILNIEWQKSKAFGFSSSALSFNQKVIIIQDLKEITAEESKKFNYLMNIRNKFAHVRSIKTYRNFYSTTGNGIEINKNLEKWYLSELPSDISEEDDIFKVYFKLLCKDLISKLYKIILQFQLEKLNKTTDEFITKIQYNELKSALFELPNGGEIIEKLEKKIGRKY